jgi:hypothetical protein
MSGIINFIKNLVGGIFGLLGGLFGKKAPAIEGVSNQPSKKNNSGYFLELDDSQAAKSIAASSEPIPVKAATEAVAEAATSTNGKTPAEPKKSTRKEKLAAAKASNGAAAKPVEPESVPVAAVVPAAPLEVGFATKYPIPASSGGRRRPGANMNSYLDMARQMK